MGYYGDHVGVKCVLFLWNWCLDPPPHFHQKFQHFGTQKNVSQSYKLGSDPQVEVELVKKSWKKMCGSRDWEEVMRCRRRRSRGAEVSELLAHLSRSS